MAKRNNKKSKPKDRKKPKAAQIPKKGKNASKADQAAKKKGAKKLKKKLSEHTSFKNKDKPKKVFSVYINSIKLSSLFSASQKTAGNYLRN